MKGKKNIVFWGEQSSLIPVPLRDVFMERMGSLLVILPNLKYLKRIACDVQALTLDLR